ncbi:GNAT family N-acetyltransferase [Phyllobacterium brassicacearum]|uniref:GNAT family N-acetyltransferase n=1 Tax=Phyllobacterium brassicacearum TaxID=314235 RepID=A0A2P7BWA1_9HYPH|nr:GNAT family N-acetyltransferase [Phyllobacterium brassicacearum]PSH70741.1 GNAT family N-acetyltransferase [Phyllobacterium brassicacearum]TDQ35781.1 N-acetylglutamate synthase-like GNAT family acetyltransferase [Phyllobacterium brassicacearum]
MPPIIRKASRADLDIMIDWAAREGWNPGLDDAPAFWAADAAGYWVAEEDNVVAAALSLVRYGATYAFLGFYMAHPDYRGQGIGFALWQKVVLNAGVRTIGLDGVVAQQDNYRKSGFVHAHANFRYGGEVQCVGPSATALVCVSPAHVPILVNYDARFNPARRDAFLREWLKALSTRKSFALIRNAEILGYGSIRACREGHKIGPLFADTETSADLIFRKLVTSVGGGRIYLDIPEPNAAARALCDRYNLKPVFETARMYRGRTPDLPLGQIYGITTFELG